MCFKQQLTNMQLFKADHSTGQMVLFLYRFLHGGQVDFVAQILHVASNPAWGMDVTYSVEQIPFSEATHSSVSQKTPVISWTLNVHYRIHKNVSPVCSLSQISPVHALPSDLRSILILSSHLCLGLPRVLFPPYVPLSPSNSSF
jgi:hypothetical protein